MYIGKWLRKHSFLISLLVGVAVGIISGVILRQYNLNDDIQSLIAYPGEIFMRALQLLILPFVVCCIITGCATHNISEHKLIAIRVVIFFFLTALISVMLGISLGLIFNPGGIVRTSTPADITQQEPVSLLDNILDIGRNLLPENLFEATFKQTYTTYTRDEIAINGSLKEIKNNELSSRMGSNTLGLIFFSVIFGSILGGMDNKKELVAFFATTCEVLQRMIGLIISCTPVCVASIICHKIISVQDLSVILQQIGSLTVVCIGGLAFYQLVLIQLIYFLTIRKNPFKYYEKTMPVLMAGFATSSKPSTIPIMFKVLEDLKMNPKITNFVIPIGTINLNGTSMFTGLALIFLAQLSDITLKMSDIIAITVVSLFGSMSSCGVPSASIVVLTTLCSIVNIPATNVGLLFSIDWLLDRFRTATNCLGDLYTVAVVEHFSQNELRIDDKVDNEVKKNKFSNENTKKRSDREVYILALR